MADSAVLVDRIREVIRQYAELHTILEPPQDESEIGRVVASTGRIQPSRRHAAEAALGLIGDILEGS